MSGEAELWARLERANPVPQPERLRAPHPPAAGLLRILEGEIMTVQEHEPPVAPSRHRLGVAAAAAAALIVIALAGTTVALLTGGEDPADATDPLPAGATPLEVVDALYARWEAGNVDGVLALAPEELLLEDGEQVPLRELVAAMVADNTVSGYRIVDRHCSADRDRVTCTVTETSAFIEAAGLDPAPFTDTITVTDGHISEWESDYSAAAEAQVEAADAARRDYQLWVLGNHRERQAELFQQPCCDGRLIITPETAAEHRALIEEWLAGRE